MGQCFASVNAALHLIISKSSEEQLCFPPREGVVHQGQCHMSHQRNEESLEQQFGSFGATDNLQ